MTRAIVAAVFLTSSVLAAAGTDATSPHGTTGYASVSASSQTAAPSTSYRPRPPKARGGLIGRTLAWRQKRIHQRNARHSSRDSLVKYAVVNNAEKEAPDQLQASSKNMDGLYAPAGFAALNPGIRGTISMNMDGLYAPAGFAALNPGLPRQAAAPTLAQTVAPPHGEGWSQNAIPVLPDEFLTLPGPAQLTRSAGPLGDSRPSESAASAPGEVKLGDAAPILQYEILEASVPAQDPRTHGAPPTSPSAELSDPLQSESADRRSQPRPIRIHLPPQNPNPSSVTGPQYFSASQRGSSSAYPVRAGNDFRTTQAPAPLRHVPAWPASANRSIGSVRMTSPAPASANRSIGMYPQTGASLYPTPQSNIPYQVGGTAFTNQAFHPHELLYPHSYKAIYPPYYYKVNGCWVVTPWGVWSHENWKPLGTEVEVKYKSYISPLSGFMPPVNR